MTARFFINAPGQRPLRGSRHRLGLRQPRRLAAAHRRCDLPAALRVEQGIEMQRPCRLLLDVGGDRKVRVGGRVVEVAAGTVTLPDRIDGV